MSSPVSADAIQSGEEELALTVKTTTGEIRGSNANLAIAILADLGISNAIERMVSAIAKWASPVIDATDATAELPANSLIANPAANASTTGIRSSRV